MIRVRQRQLRVKRCFPAKTPSRQAKPCALAPWRERNSNDPKLRNFGSSTPVIDLADASRQVKPCAFAPWRERNSNDPKLRNFGSSTPVIDLAADLSRKYRDD